MRNIRARLVVSLVAGLLAASCGSMTFAETIPKPGSFDSRIRAATYNADDVYRLEAQIGYQIDIQFERDESFLGLGAGDLQGLSFVAQGNHLFLKPKAAHVSTNLTVLTSRREYHFDYTVSVGSPDADDSHVIYSLKFVYPTPVAEQAVPSTGEVDALFKAGASDGVRNLDYWYCGHASLKPIGASDDGVHTRLRFGAHAELPAVFVRNDDGSESLLNFSVEEGDLVIHRVARRFIVRRGKLTGCIVNAGYSGSGSRVRSGTVSPAVERATRGGRS